MKSADKLQYVNRRLRVEKSHVLLAVSVAASLLVYWPVLRIYFVADDFVDMILIADQGPFHFLVSPFAGHMIFTRQVVLLSMDALFGAKHPEAYAVLNLATHALNVALVFRVTRTLTGSAELAALGAALWGTCPVLKESVGWFAVHGHLLSATFMLLVLDGLLRHHVSQTPISRGTAVRWAALLFLAATSFGGATAVAIVFPALLLIGLERPLRPPRLVLGFGTLSVLVVALYGSWNWLYSRFYEIPPDLQFIQNAATSRLGPIVEMFGYLPAVGASSLLSGFASIEPPYPVLRWVVVALFAASVGCASVLGTVAMRRQVLVLMGVALVVYATIALGRANLYRIFGIDALEAARQLRYHYVSTIPFSVILMLAISRLSQIKNLKRLPLVLFAGWVVANGYAYSRSGWDINDHRDCRNYVSDAVKQMNTTIDAAPAGADVELPSPKVPPFCTGIMAYDAIPGWAGLFVLFFPEDEVRGHKVSFIEKEEWVTELDDARHRRFWKLLLPP